MSAAEDLWHAIEALESEERETIAALVRRHARANDGDERDERSVLSAEALDSWGPVPTSVDKLPSIEEQRRRRRVACGVIVYDDAMEMLRIRREAHDQVVEES